MQHYQIQFDEEDNQSQRTSTYQLDRDLVFTNSRQPSDEPPEPSGPVPLMDSGRRKSSPVSIAPAQHSSEMELKLDGPTVAPSSFSSIFDEEPLPENFDWSHEVELFVSDHSQMQNIANTVKYERK